MVGRSLRILLVSDKHYYEITPFLAALRHSDGVEGVEVVRYVGSIVSGLEGARINTVFIDPLPPTANSLDQATRFIKCTREQFPEVVFVICSTRETILNFRAETGNEFQRFYDLDYERVHSPESPELQDVLRKCRADCEAKYRRRYAFDVALSFAGEQRDLAEQLAAALRDHGVRVFYDNYEDLWGKNLYTHLHDIYSQKARYCILFASRDYREKVWTNHEREAAQERALREKGGEYILPVRIDDTTIPGLPSTIGYISIQLGIEEICRRVLIKLELTPERAGG